MSYEAIHLGDHKYSYARHMVIEAYCRYFVKFGIRPDNGKIKNRHQVYRILLQRSKGYTYRSIGRRVGITTSRVQQIVYRHTRGINWYLYHAGYKNNLIASLPDDTQE